MMGRAHTYGYRVTMLYQFPGAAGGGRDVGRDAAAVEAAAHAYEIPSWATEWRTLIDDPTI